MPNSETDSDGGFEWRNDTDEWFPKSQSFLHHQHSNAHTPLPQKSIFNLSNLTSLHDPPPPFPLYHSLCISLTVIGNRLGIQTDSNGSAHYKLVGQLYVSPDVQCHNDLSSECNGFLSYILLCETFVEMFISISSCISLVAVHIIFPEFHWHAGWLHVGSRDISKMKLCHKPRLLSL